MGSQWLLHEAAPSVPFAPFSVGAWAIRHAPGELATEAIERLGHNALRLVEAASIISALGMAALLGRSRPAVFGLGAAAATVVAASIDPLRPDPAPAAGSAVFVSAVAWAAASVRVAPNIRLQQGPLLTRRAVLAATFLSIGSLALGGAALLRGRRSPAATLVTADHTVDLPEDPDFPSVPGLSPAITPPEDHYVVAIDLVYPSLSRDSWRLNVGGAVEQPFSLSLDELMGLESLQRPIVVACISNPVGGSLVGDSLWTGVQLGDLLRHAKLQPTAVNVLALSSDGYSETLPIDAALDPEVLVAFAMDGQPLPQDHGFPARLLVPGRYGMKGPKWLTELQVLTHDEQGYWEQRGWDQQATMRTSSRIDVPVKGDIVRTTFLVAGVAWAGNRGITAVEVSADDGASWAPAQLDADLGHLAWRRWAIELALPPGLYPLTARATDGEGALQDAERRPPLPAGATGLHRVVVTIRDDV